LSVDVLRIYTRQGTPFCAIAFFTHTDCTSCADKAPLESDGDTSGDHKRWKC
jgi:hypothetical protein